MKVDVYCVLGERFALRASVRDSKPITFNKVAALPEMTDGQLVRQAIETVYLFLKEIGDAATGVQVVIHIDDPPSGFRSGPGVPSFNDEYDMDLLESALKVKGLLTTPRDFTFKRSPNGGNLI